VDSLAESLIEALDNPLETKRRVAQAVKDISKITWESEAQKVSAFLGLDSKN
jgi:phage tail tape-measure protein